MKRLIILLLPTILFATPAQVMIIRNAETPAENTSTISLKGRERAAAFTQYFKGAPEVNFYGLPVAMYVGRDANETAQTLQPLAESIDLTLNSSYGKNDLTQLSREILSHTDYEGHTILVCWPAENIPQLAKNLGAKKIPKKWDANEYDRIWILTFSDEGEVTFKNHPQKLLYGDSK